MSDKQARLDQIRADILTQNICPDLAKTANQLVFGSGNIDADIVFIGEAPGKKEDENGEPFVGASGKLLDQLLDSIQLQRSNIYITNIVKYRPPANRDPSMAEKDAFLPYLFKQLAVINPKVVVTLGRHSAKCFLPKLVIGSDHGQPQRIKINFDDKARMSLDSSGGLRMDGVQGLGEKRNDGVLTLTVLPLYHPAAALYNGGLRNTLLEDFAIIPQLLKKSI